MYLQVCLHMMGRQLGICVYVYGYLYISVSIRVCVWCVCLRICIYNHVYTIFVDLYVCVSVGLYLCWNPKGLCAYVSFVLILCVLYVVLETEHRVSCM